MDKSLHLFKYLGLSHCDCGEKLLFQCCTFIQINFNLFVIFAIFINVLLVSAPLFSLVFIVHALLHPVRNHYNVINHLYYEIDSCKKCTHLHENVVRPSLKIKDGDSVFMFFKYCNLQYVSMPVSTY